MESLSLSVDVYMLKTPQSYGHVWDAINPIGDISSYDETVANFLAGNMSSVTSYSVPLEAPIVVPLGVKEHGQEIIYTAEQQPMPERERDQRIHVRRDPASPAMIASVEVINEQLAARGKPGLSEDVEHHHATLWAEGPGSSPFVLLTGPEPEPILGGLTPYYPHAEVCAVMTIRSDRRGPRHERVRPEPPTTNNSLPSPKLVTRR